MTPRSRIIPSTLAWTLALAGACHQIDRPEPEDVERVVSVIGERAEDAAEDAREGVHDARSDARVAAHAEPPARSNQVRSKIEPSS